MSIRSLSSLLWSALTSLTPPIWYERYLNIRGYHIVLFLKFNLWVVPQGTPQISCSNATYLKEKNGIHMKIREDRSSSLLLLLSSSSSSSLSSSSSSSSSMSLSSSSLFYLIKQVYVKGGLKSWCGPATAIPQTLRRTRFNKNQSSERAVIQGVSSLTMQSESLTLTILTY